MFHSIQFWLIGSRCLEHCVDRNSEGASGLSRKELHDQSVNKCMKVGSGAWVPHPYSFWPVVIAHGHSLYACPEPNMSAPWGLELRWIPEPECSTGPASTFTCRSVRLCEDHLNCQILEIHILNWGSFQSPTLGNIISNSIILIAL